MSRPRGVFRQHDRLSVLSLQAVLRSRPDPQCVSILTQNPSGQVAPAQEDKKSGGIFGTVKSLLGGGNGTEAQVCVALVNCSAFLAHAPCAARCTMPPVYAHVQLRCFLPFALQHRTARNSYPVLVGPQTSNTTTTTSSSSASHSKGSQTATTGSVTTKEYHSTNTYAVDTKVHFEGHTNVVPAYLPVDCAWACALP